MKECDCLDCLNRAEIFQYLTHDELVLINESRFEANYLKGEIIFKQGTAMTHLLSFRSGLAKVYIEGLNRRNLILRLVTPGQFVGGPGMYTDFKHHFTVSAVEDSKACFIDINAFKEVLSQNPVFAMQAHKSANENTLRSFTKFISLTQKQMPGRIADCILYLNKKIYPENPMKLSISRQDLADMTALSKESVIRIMKQLKDDNVISLDGHTLEILDKEALEEISRTG